LGEAATGVMRENVKRENVTHHALRFTARQPGREAFSSVSARRRAWRLHDFFLCVLGGFA